VNLRNRFYKKIRINYQSYIELGQYMLCCQTEQELMGMAYPVTPKADYYKNERHK